MSGSPDLLLQAEKHSKSAHSREAARRMSRRKSLVFQQPHLARHGYAMC